MKFDALKFVQNHPDIALSYSYIGKAMVDNCMTDKYSVTITCDDKSFTFINENNYGYVDLADIMDCFAMDMYGVINGYVSGIKRIRIIHKSARLIEVIGIEAYHDLMTWLG